ncbi:MAG TPA: aldo/keto reductase [bacterium]|nr:aldo/keto reductase [bacterium]
MLYRNIEKTGDRLSILGFGAMRLPQLNGKIDEARATRQIRHAIDQGVNYIDTAWNYHRGASEPFLGRALADGYRDKVRLATKLPHWAVGSREDMDRFLAQQLERLRTDHIDYYLIHSLDGPGWQRIRDLGAIDFLDKAKQDGRIVNRGFSYHGSKEAFREVVDAYDWEICQIQYNYLDEHNQAGKEGLEYAASRGLGVVVMEPLRGGKLGGGLPPEVEAIFQSAEVKRTPAEWALRWVWNHPGVTVVLSGMNDENHIEENLRIASEARPNSLTGKDLDLIDRVAQTYRGLMKIGCTGCQYCMPCPAGVDIQGCFEQYNQVHMFGDHRLTKFFYAIRMGGIMTGKASNASLCKECGNCVKACPQGLPIPDLLKDVSREFEGFWFKPKVWLLKRGIAVQRWFGAHRPRR